MDWTCKEWEETCEQRARAAATPAGRDLMRITPVAPNLYCADAIDDWARVAAMDLDLIVSVGGDHSGAGALPPFHGEMLIDYHMNDGRLPDLGRLNQVCEYVREAIDQGQRILIHDKTGDNRCFLVAGCAMLRAGGYGDGPAILKRLQAIRPGILSNLRFAAFIARGGY